MADDGAGDAIKVGWPTTSRAELVLGRVERRFTPRTGINTLLRVVLVKFAGSRGLGALLTQDAELLWGGVS